ncbi:hypothetical protein ACWEQ8_40615, partial [Streptomyces noursei]
MPLHSRTGHTAAVHPRPSPAREARWRAHALQDAVLLLDRYVERAGTGQAPTRRASRRTSPRRCTSTPPTP